VEDRLTFLGHSTVLVDLDDVRVLTDPMFGHMAGAIRRQVSAVPPDAFAGLAAIFISHGHWDHLSMSSLRSIPGRPLVIVPVGLGRIVSKAVTGSVHELRAGEVLTLGTVSLEAVHAEHSSRRSLFTTSDGALGLLISGSTGVYFAGDTDLFPGMTQLAGRVDVALLPVGGWGPRLGGGHLNPARAAEAVVRIRPTVAVPIHWGALFPMGLRRLTGQMFERPAEEFREAVAARAADVDVRILQPGLSMTLGGNAGR
jgi:L-ascorbate metabolism protein UlaG (beta-lactamase superfamily)